MNVSEDFVLIPVYLEPHKDVDTVISWVPWRMSACYVPDWGRIPRVLTGMAYCQGFMLPHHPFFSNTHTAALSHLPFNKPAVKPHYQGSLSNNWLPPIHPFPFCEGEGGFALSRRATADNKSKWQAHSQRPPRTKGSCLMNHRHWQPNPPPPSLHTSQMPMTDQYLGPFCNSLLAGYMSLQSGYQYQHIAGVHTAAE